MLIMRFHKLIQSKVVWIVFIGIIVISFVALQVASDSAPDPVAERLRRPVARIDGREVSFLELDVTRRLLAMQSRNRLEAELLDDLALNHLAMVTYAESLGIQVDTAFAAQEFASSFRDEKGQINEAALEGFRQRIRGTQMSETDYIEFIRQQIIVEQLRRVMAGVLLVPEFDAERWASLQTDEFVIEYAALGPQILTETVEATDEQVEAYFAENAEEFTLPEERSIRYITLTSAAQAEEIEAPTEQEAREAYLSRPEAYTRTVEVPAEEEGQEPTTATETVPFEEAKDGILEELAIARAREAAERAAMGMALRMTPRRGRTAESFDAVAADAGLEIVTTPAFSQWAPVEGPVNAPEVKQQVFELEDSEFGRRAGPLQAGDDFLLLELMEIVPPRVPELDEVRDRVRQAATNQEQRKALEAQVEVVAEDLRNRMAEGVSFEEAVTAKELNVLTSDPVSLMSMDPRRTMIPMELLREVSSAPTGELIGPVTSSFGGFFVASVKERTPQPLAKEEALPQVRQMLATQLQFQGMFSRFQENVIEPMIEEL